MALCTILHSESIEVSGDLSGSNVWQADTVFVNGDLYLEKTAHLTIDSGTRIIFTDSFSFTAEGEIDANGSAQDSIRFVTDATTGVRSTWKGIDMIGATGDFLHCVFENVDGFDGAFHYMGGAIHARDHSIVILDHCRFSENVASCGGAISPFPQRMSYQRLCFHKQYRGARRRCFVRGKFEPGNQRLRVQCQSIVRRSRVSYQRLRGNDPDRGLPVPVQHRDTFRWRRAGDRFNPPIRRLRISRQRVRIERRSIPGGHGRFQGRFVYLPRQPGSARRRNRSVYGTLRSRILHLRTEQRDLRRCMPCPGIELLPIHRQLPFYREFRPIRWRCFRQRQ